MNKTIMLILLTALLIPYNYGCLANQRTIYVDDDNIQGPWYGTEEYPYQYIQDAIKNAMDYDIVYVKNGVYKEYILIEKSIYLKGENRYTTKIVSLENLNETNVVLVKTNDVSIENFMIQFSQKHKKYVSAETGIYVESSNVTISHNIIEPIETTNSCKQPSMAIVLEGDTNLICSNRLVAGSFGFALSISSNNNIITRNEIYFKGLAMDQLPLFIAGLWLEQACRNSIKENNLITDEAQSSNLYIYFANCEKNQWYHNYWNQPRILPKPILGITMDIPDLVFMFSIDVDWNPALKPYTLDI